MEALIQALFLLHGSKLARLAVDGHGSYDGRMLFRRTFTLMLLTGLCCSQAVCMAGESFRCGQWVVSQDISVAELLKKCGEPTGKTSTRQNILARNTARYAVPVGITTTEVWTYDRGSRSFPMVVTIIDGRIDSMTRGR